MNDLSVNDVFAKIERAAGAWKLSPKDTNTLRLLGEENCYDYQQKS